MGNGVKKVRAWKSVWLDKIPVKKIEGTREMFMKLLVSDEEKRTSGPKIILLKACLEGKDYRSQHANWKN